MGNRITIVLLIFISAVFLPLALSLKFTQAQTSPPTPVYPNPVAQDPPLSHPLTPAAAFTDPVDCNQLTPPVIGLETSREQSAYDVTALLTDLAAIGYSIGSVDISAGPIPSCVDILIVRGLKNDSLLPTPYSASEGAALYNWAAAGHGLLVASDFGVHTNNTQALFQAFGYTLANGLATDSDDFDNASPSNYWVIYQSDNFADHPILNGVGSLEFLASSWFNPATNAIVTTDNNATANPPNMPVMAAFTEGQGCVVLTADSNWLADPGNGYFKENNAVVARQIVDWLSSCFSLSLQKSASTLIAQPGQLVTYTIRATNYYTTPLTGVQITDAVPAGTSFVAASNPHTGPDGGGVVTWNVGTLGINSSATVEMIVRLNSNLTNGSVITNTAFVFNNQDQPDSATVLVTVHGGQPTAVAGGPYQVNEGSTILLDGSGSSDPGESPLSYAWDLDNDGLFDDATGVTATFSAAARDDGVYPVSLQVSNGVLLDVSDTAVTVLNVAPQVALSATSWQVLVGQTVTFTGSFNDPGTLDTHTISWDFGDSSGTAVGSLYQTHQYTTLGQYTVSLTITDDDEGLGEAVHSIKVVDIFRQFLPHVSYNNCRESSTPADIIMTIDVSGSMSGPAETGNTRLDAAKQAVTTFINLLNFPADQAGIVSFGNDATLQHGLSVDKASLLNILSSLVADGITRMDLALVTSRQELTGPRHRGSSTPVMILLTDGQPNGATLETVLAEANATKAAGVTIYTIGLGTEVNIPLMQGIATTPSHYYQAPTTAKLVSIYEQIANRIQCGTTP